MPEPRWEGSEATSGGAARWDGDERTAADRAPAAPRPVAMPEPPADDGWHRQGASGPLSGKVFGDYEIGGVLGEGGMGTVYRARQTSLGRRVAVKTLASGIGNEPLQRARFEIEARAASLIQSPHVVAVHAAGSWDGTAYFVMEYVAGSDLGTLIAAQGGGGLPHARAMDLAQQAARGLAAAAAKGIVHRDIKPGNLLITAEGMLKIADFGVSKISGHDLTRTGTAVGTPSYLSPEQGRGEPTDARSDIYSLGCVLYEALTGRKPFTGDNADAVIYQHNYAEPPLPRSLDQTIPEPVQAVVLRCLQKDPARRYQTPDELIADLDKVRAGDVSLTALMQARYGTGAEEQMRRRLGRRHRWVLPLAAALVVAALAIAGLVWRQGTAEDRAVARQRIEALRGRLRDGLDAQRPPPPGAGDDCATLARLAGADDADVRRWHGKLAAVQALEQRLHRLHGETLPDAALRGEARGDIADLAALIGADALVLQRAQARLAETTAEARRLRQALAGLDEGEATLAQRERLAPLLAELVRLDGAGDADAARWQRRLSDLDGLVRSLHRELAALDAPGSRPSEPELDAHATRLDDLSRLRGTASASADELRWRTTLAAHRTAIARQRGLLTALDGGDALAEAQLDQLEPELAAYRTRVLPDDPALLRWQAALESQRRRLATLRERCAVLDRAADLPVPRLGDAKAALTALAPLLAHDDGMVRRHAAAIAAAEAAIAGWREDLAPLAVDEAIPLAAQRRATTALAGLRARQAIDETAAQSAAGRLVAEARRIAELRARCATADHRDARVSASLAEDILLYGRLVGEDDADYRRWRARIVDFVALRRRLGPLDSAAPLPDAVDADLAALAALVGPDDAQLMAWRSKVQRVRVLTAALAALDAVAAPPVQAEAALDELRQLIGAFPQEPAWRAKLARIRRLEAACGERLGDDDLLLAADARDLLDQLEAETGPTPASAAWRARAAVLAGPPPPRWAVAHAIDAHGPRAVLRLPGEPALDIVFRHVPPGRFTIGSPLDEPGRDDDELPVAVTLTRGRWMAACETSQAVYERVMGANPASQRGAELPVHQLDWHAATAFAARVADLCHVPARLPTEAEWEAACRAGGLPAPELARAAWFRATSSDGCHPVGRRPPNALGLHDLLGNVWEWCSDRYGLYPPTGANDPQGGEREERVLRGGSWADPALRLRPANRAALDPATRSVQIGVRLVIDTE